MTGLGITQEVLIEAPIEVVWHIVTTPDQMSRWFADRVDLVIEPGARGHLRFGDQGGPVLVETVEPPTRFSFRWNAQGDGDLVEGNAILVEFTLSSEGGERTRLRVDERGHELLDWPEEEKQRYADEHREGWVDFLTRLGRQAARSG